LLFFTFFFIKRIIYAIILVFLSDQTLTPLNLYIFLVTIIPMLYFSYALPFKYIGLNALLCIDEFSEFVVGVVILHYKDAWISDSEFFGYARFLIQYITIWILLHLAFLLLHLLYNIFAVCMKSWTFKGSKFKERELVSSSDSDTSEEMKRFPSDPTPEIEEEPEHIEEPENEEQEEEKRAE